MPYVIQSKGVYEVNLINTEVNQLFYKDALCIYANGENIVVRGEMDGGIYCLYEVSIEDSLVYEIEYSSSCISSSFYGRSLYFACSDGIMRYDFDNHRTSIIVDSSMKNSTLPYTFLSVWSEGIVFRHGYNYDIYYYNFESKMFECIIKSK